MDNNIVKRHFPYPFYYVPVLLLVLIGITDTTYLAFTHFKNYTDISFSSFCAISKAINCDTVAQSPWSVFLGLPIAIWGLIGYVTLFLFLIPLRKESTSRISLWTLIFLLSFIYSIIALYLGYVSATKIRSYCILCLVSYLCSFMILFSSWLVCRRFFVNRFQQHFIRSAQYIKQSIPLKFGLFFIILLTVCLSFFYPKYWLYSLTIDTKNIAFGKTATGTPWIGAEHPQLTIEEYSDYQCFQCSKMHNLLRNLISKNPDKIRLVHHHYPMDHEFNPLIVPQPFHIGSGEMAILAIYAQSQGKFWEANDLLFRLGREKKSFNTSQIAKELDLLTSNFGVVIKHPALRESLNADILRGMKLRITATPSFMISGKVYTGTIPPEILKPYIHK